MGFSGVRALILVGVLIVPAVPVAKFDLPGWFVPVGLVLARMVLKNSEQQASSRQGELS